MKGSFLVEAFDTCLQLLKTCFITVRRKQTSAEIDISTSKSYCDAKGADDGDCIITERSYQCASSKFQRACMEGNFSWRCSYNPGSTTQLVTSAHIYSVIIL